MKWTSGLPGLMAGPGRIWLRIWLAIWLEMQLEMQLDMAAYLAEPGWTTGWIVRFTMIRLCSRCCFHDQKHSRISRIDWLECFLNFLDTRLPRVAYHARGQHVGSSSPVCGWRDTEKTNVIVVGNQVPAHRIWYQYPVYNTIIATPS